MGGLLVVLIHSGSGKSRALFAVGIVYAMPHGIIRLLGPWFPRLMMLLLRPHLVA